MDFSIIGQHLLLRRKEMGLPPHTSKSWPYLVMITQCPQDNSYLSVPWFPIIHFHLYYKWDHHLFFIIIWWNFNFKSYFLFHSHVIFQHWMIEFRYWCVSVSIKHDDTSTIPKALTEPFKHSSVHVHWTSQHAMWEATMSSCMYVLLMDINWSNVVCMGGA